MPLDSTVVQFIHSVRRGPGGETGAEVARRLFETSIGLGGRIHIAANATVRLPIVGKGTKQITLFLVSASHGTFWQREREKWSDAGYPSAVQRSYDAGLAKSVGGDIKYRSSGGGKGRSLISLSPHLLDLETLLRDIVVRLRGDDRALSSAPAKWLTELTGTVRTRLDSLALAALAPAGLLLSERADRGFFATVGIIGSSGISLQLFLDDTLGADRLALWYGGGAVAPGAFNELVEVGKIHWSNTQVRQSATGSPPFRFDSPWRQKYSNEENSALEYYYGWVVESEPDYTALPAPGLLETIVDRFAMLLRDFAGSALDSRRKHIAQINDQRWVATRREQRLLRELVLRGKTTAACALCDKVYDAQFLVAAHIRRRADAPHDEKHDAGLNVMPVCTFGCDALFERGYLVVDSKGYVQAKLPRTLSEAARKYATTPLPLRCRYWNTESEHLFAAHRRRHESPN